ncbi:MAG: aminodeoxychorismate lyase, partial [Streptococcus parauberis]
MTDHKDDKQKTPSKMSFKEQILAELEKANQIRKEKEEELHQQGLREDELRQKEIEVQKATQRTAELYHEYQKEAESQTVKDSESLTIGETQPQIVPLSANHLVAEAIEVSEIESTESFSENNSLEEDSGSESYA